LLGGVFALALAFAALSVSAFDRANQIEDLYRNVQIDLRIASVMRRTAEAELIHQKDLLAEARANLDEQLTLHQRSADEWERAEAAYTAQVAELRQKLEAATAEMVFTGRALPIRITLPAGIQALETQNIVYLAERSDIIGGMIRQIADDTGAPVSAQTVSPEHIFERMLLQMGYRRSELPETREVEIAGGTALLFSFEPEDRGGAGWYGAVALLRGARGYLCFELEGPYAHRLRIERMMDEMLSRMALLD